MQPRLGCVKHRLNSSLWCMHEGWAQTKHIRNTQAAYSAQVWCNKHYVRWLQPRNACIKHCTRMHGTPKEAHMRPRAHSAQASVWLEVSKPARNMVPISGTSKSSLRGSPVSGSFTRNKCPAEQQCPSPARLTEDYAHTDLIPLALTKATATKRSESLIAMLKWQRTGAQPRQVYLQWCCPSFRVGRI